MSRYSILVIVVLLVGACKQAGPSIAKGATFAVPVPEGYKVVTDPRLTQGAPGGVVLMAKDRVAAGVFLGSIVVTRIPPGKDFDPKKPEVCREIGEQMTGAAPVTLKRAEIVEIATGKTCQYEIADKTVAHRGAIGTVLYRTRADCWVVTCNFDGRDPGARKACDAVLAGFKFN